MKVLRKLICISLSIWLVVGMMTFAGVPAEAKEKIIIKFWNCLGSGLLGKAYDKLIEEFNKTHPSIKVKETFAPNVSSAGENPKILTAIAGGVGPDVVTLDGSTFSTWTVAHTMTPIDELVKKAGIKPEDYFSFFWKKVMWKGHVYGLPLHTDVRALYWNKDIFKENGLDPERPPKTIKELDEYNEKLTKYDERGRMIRTGLLPWGGNWFLCGWGWAFGAKLYDEEAQKIMLNHPKMVEALKWEVSYAKKYGVEATQAFAKGFGSGAMEPFISGKTAMEIREFFGNYYKYGPNLNFGLTNVPYPPGGRKCSWSGGFVVAMPVGCKHPKEAWEFMKFIGGPYAQKVYCPAVWAVPTLKVLAKDPVFTTDPNYRKLMKLMPFTLIEPVIPEWSLAWDEMIAATEAAIFLKKSPKEALDEANAKVQAAIDKRIGRK